MLASIANASSEYYSAFITVSFHFKGQRIARLALCRHRDVVESGSILPRRHHAAGSGHEAGADGVRGYAERQMHAVARRHKRENALGESHYVSTSRESRSFDGNFDPSRSELRR